MTWRPHGSDVAEVMWTSMVESTVAVGGTVASDVEPHEAVV
jgi:hypothetical protein